MYIFVVVSYYILLAEQNIIKNVEQPAQCRFLFSIAFSALIKEKSLFKYKDFESMPAKRLELVTKKKMEKITKGI